MYIAKELSISDRLAGIEAKIGGRVKEKSTNHNEVVEVWTSKLDYPVVYRENVHRSSLNTSHGPLLAILDGFLRVPSIRTCVRT